MDLKSLGEFGLIEKIRSQFPVPQSITGIGDDCSIIPQKTGFDTLVSTDMLVEGTHFLLSDILPKQLGWKSVAVNLSDIAAMGGELVGTFLSIALPKHISVDWVEQFMLGYKEISDMFSVPLLGGDTTSSDEKLCINVTVLGKIPTNTSKKRSDAKVGDLVCVTGNLGDSGAGLKAILESVNRSEIVSHLISKHYHPMPRVTEGISLRNCDGVHAMMDISDGIGSDVRHILKASHVGAEINVNSIPISKEMDGACEQFGWNKYELATSGGEDYELLFTIDENYCKQLSIPYFVIGKIVTGDSLKWLGSENDFIGYRHF